MQEAETGSKVTLREGNYPVRFSVEYPESRNRLTVLLRLILAAPIIVLMQFLSGDTIIGQAGNSWEALLPLAVMLWIAPLLMIVFPQKYPLWCFDTYLELNRFSTRVLVYLLLLRDDYPSLDEQQAVSLQIEYPDVEGQLNRFLPLVKWLLVIPHVVILLMLWAMVLVVTVIAWFAILIVGRYPKGLFRFVEGTIRWSYRVYCYAFMLTTDRYPPSRFGP